MTKWDNKEYKNVDTERPVIDEHVTLLFSFFEIVTTVVLAGKNSSHLFCVQMSKENKSPGL